MTRPTLALTPAQITATEDRETALRAARPDTPSQSTVPHRCSTCGHWNRATADYCADCGLVFVARPSALPARAA